MLKNAIITGSSTGIGFLCVKKLAANGHTVFATMRDVNGRNKTVAKELKNWADANHFKVEIIELDVTNGDSVKAAVEQVAGRTNGKIDVLINNAALSYMGATEALELDQTERLFQVNVFGPERMIKAVLPFMHKRHNGLIINMTSVPARNFIPVFGAYNSTKAALDAISVGYHFELKPSGIEVVTIQSGAYVATDPDPIAVKTKDKALWNNHLAPMIRTKSSLFKFFDPAPYSPDPQEVAGTLLDLVEMTDGTRPLWTVVNGGELTDTFNEANNSIKQVAEAMLGFLTSDY